MKLIAREERPCGVTTTSDLSGWSTLSWARIDAQNIFDGLSLEDYPQFEDTFYHYLNAGLRVPFSTGTDWFLFDLARVYTRVAVPLGISSWLEALKQGRSFITNGPLFHFQVEDQAIGDTVSLKSPGEVGIEGRVSGRVDFGHLELVHNGQVVHRIPSRAKGEHFSAELKKEFRVDEPGWLALRVSGEAKSEYGLPIFGHTSAIYLEVDGKIDPPARRGGPSKERDSGGESYGGRRGALCHARGTKAGAGHLRPGPCRPRKSQLNAEAPLQGAYQRG